MAYPGFQIISFISLALFVGQSIAVSQFQSDAAFCVVDTNLNITTDSPVIRMAKRYAPTLPPPPPMIVGFNEITFATEPLLLRGDDGQFNTTSGHFDIIDDGTYVFIVTRVGVSVLNGAIELVVANATDDEMNTTLAVLDDLGEGNILTMYAVADLKRGQRVLIANELAADVIGDLNNPFLYNAFLLYHTPISPFPRVRQSAFTATVFGNLSIAGTTISDYDPATVNIGSGFESESGVFTAPMKGVYIFHASIKFLTLGMSVSGTPAVSLEVNEDTRAKVMARFDVPAGKNAAITIAQTLQQGDEVFLQNGVSTPQFEAKVVFTGYLLS